MFEKIRHIKTIKSTKEIYNIDIKNEDIRKHVEGLKAYVVGWYQDGLLFDIFDKDISYYLKENLINLRIFNEEKEIFIYKTKNAYKLRKIEDGAGDDVKCFDADQIMWGTNAKEKEDKIEVFEERGIKFLFPKDMVENILDLKDNKHMLVLRTRNYIDFLDNYQASIEDARFLGFKVKPLGGNI